MTSLVLIPHFAPNDEYRILTHRYAFLGAGPAEAIQSLLHDPLLLLKQVLRQDKVLAFVHLLASMAFLPLLGGGLLLVAIPLIWYMQLSENHALAILKQWHPATYLPVCFGAILIALRRFPVRWRDIATRNIAVGVLLWASVLTFMVDGSAIQILQEPGMDPDRRQVIGSLMEQIPPEASVSAQDQILPHLSHRREIYLFPTVNDADYVLMDRLGSTYPLQAEDYENFWQASQEPPGYSIVYNDDGFLMLRREAP